MRIALVETPGDWPIDPDVAANTRAAGQAFREAGALVDEVELAVRREDVVSAMLVHFGAIFAADILQDVRGAPRAADPLRPPHGRALGGSAPRDRLHRRPAHGSRHHGRDRRVFAEHDLLLLPTVVTRGFVAGDDYVDHGVTVGGEELPEYFDAFLTPLFNIASRCPVLNVPSGFADNGVPTGLQIVGRPYEDVSVFRAGAAYERLRPWLDAAERRPLQSSAAASPRP